jgi:carbon-monoxide dehydrogenase large subunit
MIAYSARMGVRVKRKEDMRLITGSASYVGDMKAVGLQHVAFVRSPYAHANIRSIDISAAQEVPGVFAVLTGEDLKPWYEPMLMSSAGEGDASAAAAGRSRSHYALSIDRVRYVGEAVVAVLAESPAIAADAAALVVIDWEPLPAIVDVRKALEDGAPQLFEEAPGNLVHTWTKKSEGFDAAFESAAHVVRERIVSQRLSGIPMEGRAVMASYDSTTNGIIVHTSTQGPHIARAQIASTLRLPENAVRVIVPEVGGGFGVKIAIYPEEIALSAMALAYRVPVRWVETRVEHMIATTHGRAQSVDMEAAVAEDGTINALRMRVVADVGAYPVAPDIPDSTGLMAIGVYKIPEVDIDIRCGVTNTTPVAAYRGAGRPEAAYYIERIIDVIAHDLKLDPIEVRRRNFIPPADFPYATPTGVVYDSGEYDRALIKALEVSKYNELRAEQERLRNDPNSSKLLGIGLATYVEVCAFGYESAIVRADPSGTVTVFTGTSPHGQGLVTAFSQIVADQLGVDFDKIIVRHGDTATIPFGQGTMGSRSMAVGGSAIYRASLTVREKAFKIAAHMLEAAVEDIVFDQGRYHVKGSAQPALSFEEIAERAYNGPLPEDIAPGLEATDFFRPPDNTYPFGAHVAVVEIERETGHVTVRDFFSVDDCGPRINPMLAEGQVHGGLAQGISQALWEEIVYDEGGQVLTGSLMDYIAPRASMFPQYHTDQTETPTPRNPLGVKGIGEAATIGSTPAIVNAVVDALQVRHLDMPLRDEKVWRALNNL